MLGLLAVAVALTLVAAFFGRLSELGVLGVTVKLAPAVAAAVGDIASRTPDPKVVDDVVRDFLLRLMSRLVQEPNLDPADVVAAKEEALSESVRDIDADITIEHIDGQAAVRVERRDAGEGRPEIRVSTAPMFLAPSVFDDSAVERIERAEARLGRRLFAIDPSTDECLAALAYELPEDAEAPIVIDVLATHNDPALAGPALGCAATLMIYLHTLARRLGRDGVVIRLDQEPDPIEQQQLAGIGFRPKNRDDALALPDGTYWRHDAV